jgi:adenylate cyclase
MPLSRPRASSDPHLDLLELVHMAGGGTLLLFGVGFWMLDLILPAIVVGSYGILTFLTLIVLQLAPGSFRPVVWMHVVVVSLVPFGVCIGLGGLIESGGYMIWGLIGPLAAMMFLGRRATFVAIGIFLACLVTAAILPLPDDAAWVTPPPGWLAPPLGVANIAGAAILCLATLTWFVRRMRHEQERSDRLLLGVLPPDVSRALRSRDGGAATKQGGASILVVDIVDLVPLHQEVGAAQISDMLAGLYIVFGDLAARHQVKAVRTPGEVFLAIAGLPEPNARHAHTLAQLALDMRQAVASQRFAGQRVDLRIGINSGPVFPGLSGRRRFIFEIWGRALNLSARLEALGQPGCILLTQESWELLRHEFRCRATGMRTSSTAKGAEVWELLDRYDEEPRRV